MTEPTGGATAADAPIRARAPLAAWLLAPLLVLVALVYWPGLDGGFAFDDVRNITANRDLHVEPGADAERWRVAALSSPARELPRPLALLTFAANHVVSGLDPRPMKLTNLAIHLFNVLLVFACTLLLLRALPGAPRAAAAREPAVALAVAALWGLHPINLMAVLYVVQRMESLAHTFVLAGLALYLLGRLRQIEGRAGWTIIFAGLLGGSFLGAMAKESAVLLPLYACLAELLVLRGRGAQGRQSGLRRLHALVLALPAVLGSIYLLRRFANAGAYAHREFTLVERLLTEPRVVLDYLNWTLLPSVSKLGLYHDDYPLSHGLLDPPATALAIVGVALLAAAAWALRARRPLAALGLAWFLAAQALTATFIPLELVYEHRNYFASFGVCLVLADVLLLLPASPRMRRGGVLLALVLGVLFTSVTYQRARDWSDPVRFAASEAQHHPRSPRATYSLAAQMVGLTGYRADSPYTAAAHEAIEQAIAVGGDSVMPEQAALIFAARSGRPLEPAWWTAMEDGLRNHPDDSGNQGALAAMGNCAIEGLCRFPRERMVAIHLAALEKHPTSGTLTLFGRYALHGLRDPALALRLWEEAVARSPRNPQFRINLARLDIALGRNANAREQIDALRRLDPLGRRAAETKELEAQLAARRGAPSAPPDQPSR